LSLIVGNNKTTKEDFMPTLSRSHQLKDNIAYHVINRGNGRHEIFHEHEDYERFEDIAGRYVLSDGLKIYHYSLIPNHYHLELALEDPESLSSIMAGINRGYTHYHHKKYKTFGHLWQGRFISRPIEKDAYLIRCGGYVEMNPVRAKLVKSPEEYDHSSSRYYILGEPNVLITEDPAYLNFGVTAEERQKVYLDYLLEMDQEQEGRLLSRGMIGSKEFCDRLCRKKGRLVPRRRGRRLARN
jgi:putative transposase